VKFDGIDLGERGIGAALEEKRAAIVLSPEASSLSAARAFVSSMLELWECEDPDQVARLLTSEVVSNAVRHAASPIELEVAMVNDHQLRVRARDEAPHAKVARDLHRPQGEGGHGLQIIECLAERWGVERYEDHKVVWFETFALPRLANLL
jgi:anti-sigma regulatory factor (Ser/Thr protein kinase)